jgi:hypothetical protein
MWRYLLGVGVILALLVYIATDGTRAGLSESGSLSAVGTSGITETDGAIHELETITGMNDAQELVGRRVDLHVRIQRHLNDVAFWIGSADNRLLVVLARDTRDGATKQKGEPPAHGLDAEYEQIATVSGAVHPLPGQEAMHSWGLTELDRDHLLERRIYIRADAVTPQLSASTTPSD